MGTQIGRKYSIKLSRMPDAGAGCQDNCSAASMTVCLACSHQTVGGTIGGITTTASQQRLAHMELRTTEDYFQNNWLTGVFSFDDENM